MMLLKHAKPKIEYIIRKYIIEIETKNSQEWGGEGRKEEGRKQQWCRAEQTLVQVS